MHKRLVCMILLNFWMAFSLNHLMLVWLLVRLEEPRDEWDDFLGVLTISQPDLSDRASYCPKMASKGRFRTSENVGSKVKIFTTSDS